MIFWNIYRKARRLAATAMSQTPRQVCRATHPLVMGLEWAFTRDNADEVGKLLRIGGVVAWETVQT